MTDHPRDEFDAVPESSNRQGVHRERIVPARPGGLGLKIAGAVLALLIGLGSYFILPSLGFRGAGENDAAAPAASSQAAAPDAGAEPSDGAPADTGGGASGTPDADDAIDREQTVNVLNGTGIPGLATVGANRLAAAGWTDTVPGNWAGAPVDSSVVFFNGETQRADAEAVAADLGILDLIDGADVSPDISVVLGPEFE